MKKAFVWFKGLSFAKRALLVFGTLVLVSAGGHNQNLNSNTGANSSDAAAKIKQTSAKPAKHVPVITTKTVTEAQPIVFESTTVEDAATAKGTTKITTAGVNGVKTLTYELTLTDGKQTNKVLKSEAITQPPVTQVTTVGTYVAPAQPSCPNGTYVNSAGNTVCSPYESSSAPAGATARCVDGTYSFSQSRSGTCSHHGGVSTWL
ncbi:MAG: type 3 domain protein [Candidatus Saccharibacteria bacterium]|nr:type 3 domain protein [Candidatus Saccharibacteria bacterium]